MFIDSDSPIGFNRLSESWIVPLAFAIFPVRAMALEQVMYRCGALGDVSVDRSRANPSKAVVVYGDQRWPGTISAGSMTFFSSTSQGLSIGNQLPALLPKLIHQSHQSDLMLWIPPRN